MADLKLLIHVSDIVAAHLTSNVVASQDIPQLIMTVYESLAGLEGTSAPTGMEDVPAPAMTIRASVKPGSVGCLECGKRFKALRKHLGTHDLTADEYRAKWSLPVSYSMVSADYSAKRSGLAKANGLGRSKGQNQTDARHFGGFTTSPVRLASTGRLASASHHRDESHSPRDLCR
ncbi:MucR family transcriptional regulator [Sphingomonas glacialis]|uniref:MucR family transcriptional regulator n=1 Tax=Sphingomonas glacialis TaxID=658225 RepID=A0A502FAS6_9SPHN|nr:MucR family transcriptional regulator [Sphingomonas glacialis]TPG46506.1 MucR family transcriptional regulator [Sphingomonas glacialis]